MRYCRQCGGQLEEEGSFCPSCGEPLEEYLQNSSVSAPSRSSTSVKQPMSGKNKKLLIFAGIAVILLISAYITAEKLTSKDRLLNNFKTAMLAKDASKMADLLTASDKNLVLDQGSVKGLLDYYRKNPNAESQLYSDLQAQSIFLDNADGAYQINSVTKKNKLINLRYNGKFLFFNTYKLEINPVFLTLETNYKNTAFYIDGKNVGTSSKYDFKKTYGPFVPGIHKTEARLKNKYVNLKTDDEIEILSGSKSSSLELKGHDMTVNVPSSKTGTAKLYINGKDMGVNLFKDSTFGPVTTDGSMKMSVVAEFPWGTETSKEVPIKKENMDVDLASSNLKKKIMDIVNEEFKQEMKAIATGDTSVVTLATDNKIDDISDTDFSDLAEYVDTISLSYNKFDLDSFRVGKDGNKWVAAVTFETKLSFESEAQGERSYTEASVDLLSYDEKSKKWLVYDNNLTDKFNEDHVKLYNNPNPEKYSVDPNEYDDTWE